MLISFIAYLKLFVIIFLMADFRDKLIGYQKEAEERIAKEKAASLGLEYVNLLGKSVDPEAMELVKEENAKEALLVPIGKTLRYLKIGCFDPNLPKTKKIIENLKLTGYKVKIFIVTKTSLKHFWNFYKYIAKPKKKIIGLLEIEEKDLETFGFKNLTLEKIDNKIKNFQQTEFKKISTLLEMIMAGGIVMEASDVHLEPKQDFAILRYRLDGLLYKVSQIDLKIFTRLINRIKLIGQMKINVKDSPQDGRFTVRFKEADIEIRASVIPSEYGEMVVLRILDPKTINLKLEDLGLRKDHLEIIKAQLKKPNGLILNTGPTGSGKTTTLYTFLRYKQNPTLKIITVEDPIEYRLKDIDQTQVDRAAGYTFASGLRSILRQDPDVILVGEIRDNETAQIAMHSSLTGHLVFSTLHTNDAAGSVQRLIDMEISPSVLASALSMAIAQRLVRRLCKDSAEFKKPSKEFLKALEKVYKKLPDTSFLPKLEDVLIGYPKKTESCPLGYKGRLAIFELFVVDGEIERLINKKPSHIELLELAKKHGMTTLQEDALLKIAAGITSIKEAERVVGKLF